MRKAAQHLLIPVLVLAIAASASAGDFWKILGGQRVGTSSMTYLKIPVGARAEAMGGAYVAIANDPFAVYWNPAGIAQIANRWKGKYTVDPMRPPEGTKAPATGMAPLFSGDRTLGVSRINYFADITLDAITFVHPLPAGVVGVNLTSLSTPDMEITTVYQPDGTGQYFSYSDMLLGVSYALQMTDNFSWGVTFKYAREQLADVTMNNVMFDLGTYYWTGYRDLRIGVSLMHFGPTAKPGGTYVYTEADGSLTERSFTSYAPPTVFQLGGAMTVFAWQQHRVLTSLQLNHPVDNSENIKLGMEYGFMGMLFVRGGYKINTDEDRWAFGGGVRVPWRGFAVSADYSYTDFGILSTTHRVSLGIAF